MHPPRSSVSPLGLLFEFQLPFYAMKDTCTQLLHIALHYMIFLVYFVYYSTIISYSVVFSTVGSKDLKERISDSKLFACSFLLNVGHNVCILNLCNP